MAKTLKYRKAILQFLDRYVGVKPANWREAQQQIIADTRNNHYQLVRMGWKAGIYYHYPIFHFDIAEEKVIVQQNRTDLDIQEALEEYGIAKQDVILAAQLPAIEPTWKVETAALSYASHQ